MKLFLSPHNDDEALFGAFTILREKPLVVIVTDSLVQEARGTGITAMQRRSETERAMTILGAECEFMQFGDDDLPRCQFQLLRALRGYGQPEMVYAPAPEPNGHPHHNLIGEIARDLFDHVTLYMTYTTAGKSVSVPVPFESGWPLLKLKALACYESQIAEPSTRDHFLREQYEYTLE